MKVKEVTMSVGRTYNLGSVESLWLECSVTATVDNGGVPEVQERLYAMCAKGIDIAYARKKELPDT